MKRNLFLAAAFALTVLCATSCSTESKVDRLISRMEKAIESKDEAKIAKVAAEMEEFDAKHKDYKPTEEQTKRMLKLDF